ncbi:hypothetical protein ACQPW3_25610 [Actinosynnema sp. CA-248983]
MTLEEFAEYAERFAREHGEAGTLGLRHLQRLAAGRKSSGEPLGPVRQVTARLLESIFEVGIEELLAPPVSEEPLGPIGRVEPPGRADVEVAGALQWLDERAGWVAGTARARVRARLSDAGPGALLDRRAGRARVGRREIVRELGRYYGGGGSGFGLYHARCGEVEIDSTLFGRTAWWHGVSSLDGADHRLSFTVNVFEPLKPLSERAADAAVARLAEAVALGVRVANLPLYRLLEI